MAGSRRRQQQDSKASPAPVHFNDEYFVFPHIFWMIAIPAGFYLLGVATFSPDSAFHFLPWPVSNFVNYMGRSHRHICISLCVFAVVVHCVEAAYAGKVCQDKRLSPVATAKWSFITFLFGFASLSRLLKYKSQKDGDKKH